MEILQRYLLYLNDQVSTSSGIGFHIDSVSDDSRNFSLDKRKDGSTKTSNDLLYLSLMIKQSEKLISRMKKNLKLSKEQFNTEKDKERIMIDFDGVIHSYDKGWQDGRIYGNPIKGTKEALEKLRKKYEIVIFTTRASNRFNESPTSDELIEDLKKWLAKHEIPYDEITSEKYGAIAYIDDKAIRFEGNWSSILSKLEKLNII